MRFQTKIIVGYTLFVFVLALVLGFVFFQMNASTDEEREKDALRVAADSLVTQMDEKIGQMEASMNYILSDPVILDSIYILGRAEGKTPESSYVAEARKNIQAGINTDYIITHCYRTVVFNRSGDMSSTYSSASRRAVDQVNFEVMPYLDEADEKKGRPILIGAHEDAWGFQENPQVFSLLKAVQGYNTGYIEVENRVDMLDELQVPKDTIEYIVMVNEDEFLYGSNGEPDTKKYKEIISGDEEFVTNSSDREELIAKGVSRRYDMKVLAIESTDIITAGHSYKMVTTILIALVFFLLSMCFVILLSHIVTKPIRQLRSVMENTKLENISRDVLVKAPNDEIEALSRSYRDVLSRLQKSMIKEKRLSILQLQAQFDSLQAQVNPHFIYNVLNVIGAKGIANGEEEVCKMCGSLAAMLRYSTNNKNRYAVILEELQYLEEYFYLLKARYEHKIEFEVKVDEVVKNQIIPKVALQQVVENCMIHGFENSISRMKVEITGWTTDSFWYIRINDNGQGFKKEALEELKTKMVKTRKILLEDRDNMELEIGGMGLVNTYARCLLLYSDSLVFELNNVDGGAGVIIGAALTTSEELACTESLL